MQKRIFFLLAACLGIGLIAYIAISRYQARQQLPDEAFLHQQLTQKPLNHLGIIMDGNRRWAKRQGLKPWVGHQKGVDPIKETLQFCKDYGIKHLTLYVFSLENFNRPQEELSYLFDILAQEIASKEMDSLFKEGVCVSFVGDRSKFPAQLVPIIDDIESKTSSNSNLHLNLLFCYGGQQEIAAAARDMVAAGKPVSSYEEFKEYLWSANVPAIDLVIRTAGDQRLSNFLPLQAAYSELYFTPCFWPELTKPDLLKALEFFVSSKRNFGK